MASPHRINLEEPVRVASPHMINLEEPISSGYPAPTGLTWRNPVRVASPHRINLEEPVRVASPHRINLTLCPSVSPSVSKGLEKDRVKECLSEKERDFCISSSPRESWAGSSSPREASVFDSLSVSP